MTSTWMTAGDGTTGRESKRRRVCAEAAERWPQLPDDLLSIVYGRVATRLARVRFAAVCKPWRDFASRHPAPLPALPWLFLPSYHGSSTKRLYSLEDGAVLDVRLPCEARGKRFLGFYDGGWVVAHDGRAASASRQARFRTTTTSGPLVIVNLFSGAEVALSQKQRDIVCTCPDRRGTTGPCFISKIVFSEDPTSSRCILAAMTDRCRLALCRVGCPEGGWTVHGCGVVKLKDITFFNGELYGLTEYDGLRKFDIGVSKDGAPMVMADTKVADYPVFLGYGAAYTAYILDFSGKLAIAVTVRRSSGWSWDLKRPLIRVYELVDDDEPHEHTWVQVTSLGDYAFFLGPTCSKAVRLPPSGRGGVQRNRIYYQFDAECLKSSYFDPMYLVSSEDGGGDHVYCREDRNVGDEEDRIVSAGYYVRGGPRGAMWLLPPDL